MPTSPPLPRARRCHTSGGPGTQESLKLRLGRCGDPRGPAAPSRGLPAVGSERCQGVRHYRGRAARSRARGSRGTRVLAKLERGGRVDPRPGAPQPGGRPLRGEPGRPNQVGTRGKPRASGAHREAGARAGSPGARGGDAGRLGRELTCRQVGQRRGCLFALRTRPPARWSARLPAAASSSFSSTSSSRAPAAAALPVPNPPGPPPRAAGGRQSHPLTSGWEPRASLPLPLRFVPL